MTIEVGDKLLERLAAVRWNLRCSARQRTC
jgi:hypothetical protein